MKKGAPHTASILAYVKLVSLVILMYGREHGYHTVNPFYQGHDECQSNRRHFEKATLYHSIRGKKSPVAVAHFIITDM